MDIDIDSADRDKILALIDFIPASILRKGEYTKHNTGVHVTDIPYNPDTGLSTLDYNSAELLGYVKLDLLNVHVYEKVRDIEHLDVLLSTKPNWDKLDEREFVEQLIHINNHYDLLKKMPQPVNSIPRLAMFLAIIRPAKRHLVGKTWKEVAEEVWNKPDDDSYFFKKSHSIAYAHLIVIHMNLLTEEGL